MDPRENSGGGDGKGSRGRDSAVRSGAGLLGGFQDLRGVEEPGGVNVGDACGSEELDGDVRGRDGFWEFGEEQDIVGIDRKERGENSATKGLNGGADEFKAIAVVMEDTLPGGGSEADLVTEVEHEVSFWGKGNLKGPGDDEWRRC